MFTKQSGHTYGNKTDGNYWLVSSYRKTLAYFAHTINTGLVISADVSNRGYGFAIRYIARYEK